MVSVCGLSVDVCHSTHLLVPDTPPVPWSSVAESETGRHVPDHGARVRTSFANFRNIRLRSSLS